MQVHKKIYHPFTLSEVATRRCVPPKLRKKTEKQVDTEFRKGDLTAKMGRKCDSSISFGSEQFL